MPANTGRNDPCPCGSGKKYKQCHLAADEAKEREARAKATAETPGSRRRSRGRGRGPGAGRAAEARDAAALEEDRDQHAGLRQDQPAPQGRRRLEVAWRRLAAALVAASGLACASATNYLDPQGPLHEFRREPPPRPASAGDGAPARGQLQHRLRGPHRPRARGAAGDRGAARSRRAHAAGDGRPGHRADREGARDERGVLPERGPSRSTTATSAAPCCRRGRSRRRASSCCRTGRGAAACAAPRRSPRSCAAAQRIRVYSLHLPSPLAVSGGSRREQLRVIGADAATSADPVLIAGRLQQPRPGRGAGARRLRVADAGPRRHHALQPVRHPDHRPELRPLPHEGPSPRPPARPRSASSRTTTTRATTCRSGRCSCPRTSAAR